MKILIVGATSAIATATARILAERGDSLFLAARDKDKLESVAADLRVRGAALVETASFDAAALDAHDALVREADARMGGLDALLVAHGVLPDPEVVHHDGARAAESLRTNLLSVVTVVTPAAELFEARRAGCIAVIGSVAGDRGRQSNYVYGTSKAGVATFLQGLRHRMHGKGVRVVNVKPGFVDTPMTAHIRKGILFASPAKVARRIVRALDKGDGVVYAPGFWRPILFAVRNVPAFLFHRTKL